MPKEVAVIYFEVISKVSEITEGNQKMSLNIAVVLTEFRTRHLPITSQRLALCAEAKKTWSLIFKFTQCIYGMKLPNRVNFTFLSFTAFVLREREKLRKTSASTLPGRGLKRVHLDTAVSIGDLRFEGISFRIYAERSNTD
jgi:hypothetical protein